MELSLIVAIVMLGAGALFRLLNEASQMDEAPPPPPKQLAAGPNAALGRPIIVNVEVSDDEPGNDPELTRISRVTASVHDVMPPWLSLYGGPRQGVQRNWWLATLVFGERVNRLPSAFVIQVDQGSFILTTNHPFRGSQLVVVQGVNAQVALLLQAFGERGAEAVRRGIFAEAEGIADHEVSDLALTAFDYVCRHLPEDPSTGALRARAFACARIEARALAALYEDRPEGRDTLRDVVLSRPPVVFVDLRHRALRWLIKRRDLETLLRIDGRWPASLLVDWLDTLAKSKDPRAEAKILPFLQHDDAQVVEAAVDALARVGSRDSVYPLTELRRVHLGVESLTIGIDVAVELIKDRLQARPGAVSLTDEPDKGQLSPVEAGQMSLAAPDPPSKKPR